MSEINLKVIAAGEGGGGENQDGASGIAGVLLRNTERSGEKIILPRRPGELRFGPQPYYYPASRTGVVPRAASSSDRGPPPFA